MKLALPLLCLLLGSSTCMAQAARPKETPVQSGHPRVFDQVAGMPLDQVLLTSYDLNRDAARWKKTLSQISPSSGDGFLLDTQVRALIHDANESLDDIEKATTTVVGKSPRVAEVIAIAFDLSRLHEAVVNISGLIVIAHNSPEAVTTATASTSLKINADRWQQIATIVAGEVQTYRDGWESYTFHLGQTIDDALPR